MRYIEDLPEDARELVSLVRDVPPHAMTVDVALPTWQLAARNELDGVLAHAVRDAGGMPPAAAWDAHERTRVRLGAWLEELDRLAERLERDGIKLVALKNGGIARGLHPCRGCSPMGDLDVLVSRDRFLDAHHRLVDEGYEPTFRGSFAPKDLNDAIRSGGLEYRRAIDGGDFWLELQWRPVGGRWIRQDQEPDAAALIERSLPIPGTVVRLLSPNDNLLQVALHTAKHSFVRAPGFRLHLDVDRIVRRQHIDWDRFTADVVSMEVRTPVYYSLAIPAALLGTPIPPPQLDRLRPSVWRTKAINHLLNEAGLFDAAGVKLGHRGHLLLHAMLYESAGGLLRAVFPSRETMDLRYGPAPAGRRAVRHLFRLFDLTFRRENT